MVKKTIFNGWTKASGAAILFCRFVSAPVVKYRYRYETNESVALRVAYERKGTKWKKLTDTVTYFIVKDSLSKYTYSSESVIFIIKRSYELRIMLLRGACKSATPIVGM